MEEILLSGKKSGKKRPKIHRSIPTSGVRITWFISNVVLGVRRRLGYIEAGRGGIQFCACSAVKRTISTTRSVRHPPMNAVTLTATAQRSFVSFCFSSPAYKYSVNKQANFSDTLIRLHVIRPENSRPRTFSTFSSPSQSQGPHCYRTRPS